MHALMKICVVGLQWGDEGKGKVVDILAENSDTVVRFGGGANAGHTVIVGDNKFAYGFSVIDGFYSLLASVG